MPLGIAVVGLDHWYTAFGALDTCAASEATPLVAVVEGDAARREEVRGKYAGVPLVTDSLAEALAREDVALVAICASTDQAPEIAKAALAAGKHVVSVKPPARTLAELDGVLAAADASGRFYGSFEGMQRLHPRTLILRDLIRDGAIGTPLSYHQIGHGGLPAPWPGGQSGAPSWWIDAAKVPGGAWLDHAIYAVDLARFVFGGEVTYATGLIENRVLTDLVGLEDYGAALLRLSPASGGANVSLLIEDTWAAKPGGGTHMGLILGSEGSIRAEGGGWSVTKGGQVTQHDVPESKFFCFDLLADLLERGETPPFGPADARANLAACLAVYEAAARL